MAEADPITTHKERMEAHAPVCSCVPHPYGDGPEIDCPVHGAMQAFNEATAENARLRWLLTEARDALISVAVLDGDPAMREIAQQGLALSSRRTDG